VAATNCGYRAVPRGLVGQAPNTMFAEQEQAAWLTVFPSHPTQGKARFGAVSPEEKTRAQVGPDWRIQRPAVGRHCLVSAPRRHLSSPVTVAGKGKGAERALGRKAILA